MYSSNGDFGQVRLARLMEPMQSPHLFMLSSIGWHSCNDQYRIVRPNGADKHLLLFTVKGEGFLRLHGRRISLLPGTVYLVPRLEENAYGTPPGGLWEFFWIHPTGASTPFLDQVITKGRLTMPIEMARIQQIEEMLSLCVLRPQHFEWRLSQMLSALLHHIAIGLCAGQEKDPLSRKAIQLMESRLEEKFTLDEIAQTLYVSTAHLIRMFRQEMGCTPHWYLTQYRLMRAEQLLRFSSLSIAEIAGKTGFSSPSHFISQFKAAHGCTPMQYRQHAEPY